MLIGRETFTGPDEAREDIRNRHRIDRTVGQAVSYEPSPRFYEASLLPTAPSRSCNPTRHGSPCGIYLVRTCR